MQKNKKIMILVVVESSASVAFSYIDILNLVGKAWDGIPISPTVPSGFDIQLATFQSIPLQLNNGIQICNLVSVKDAEEPDIVIVPDLMIGADIELEGIWVDEVEWIRSAFSRGKLIVGACTGSILLAKAGILDGEMATTHWAFYSMMENNYERVKLNREDRLVVSGKNSSIVTTGGYSTSKELMIYLVQRFFGKAEMIRVVKLFLFGKYNSGQQPFVYLDVPIKTKDQLINKSIEWLVDNEKDSAPINGMIEKVGLPYSTFIRRFKIATGFTPRKYVQYFRVEQAKKLLELTNIPSDQVCFDVGYEDPRSFRSLFKRLVHLTPSEYRRQFSTMDKLLAQRCILSELKGNN